MFSVPNDHGFEIPSTEPSALSGEKQIPLPNPQTATQKLLPYLKTELGQQIMY